MSRSTRIVAVAEECKTHPSRCEYTVLPTRPYLLIGVSVNPATPDPQGLEASVVNDMPLPIGVPPTEVFPNVYLLRCATDDPDSAFQNVFDYMRVRDQQAYGIIWWFVQLCRTNEFAGG